MPPYSFESLVPSREWGFENSVLYRALGNMKVFQDSGRKTTGFCEPPFLSVYYMGCGDVGGTIYLLPAQHIWEVD